MNGNCHFVFATATGSAIAMNLDKITTLGFNFDTSSAGITLIIMGSLIGGIFPDIDNPDSSMGHLSRPLSTIIGKIGKFTGKTGVNHRGIFHDIAIYIAGLILSYLYFPPVIGFFIGAISHLMLDSLNPMGVPILFGIRTFRLAKVRSGSKWAIALTWMLTFIVLCCGIFFKYC